MKLKKDIFLKGFGNVRLHCHPLSQKKKKIIIIMKRKHEKEKNTQLFLLCHMKARRI